MLKITILGCGSSGGVPIIGGADGHGDWGACDPGEPRNRRSRSRKAHVVRNAEGAVAVLREGTCPIIAAATAAAAARALYFSGIPFSVVVGALLLRRLWRNLFHYGKEVRQ